MSLASKIREQLLSSFRAELAEHIQTITDGLLALEEGRITGGFERQATFDNIFRAAHSMKGAARAVGVTAVEQVAHALEDVLAAFQQQSLALTPELCTMCYAALDAIQLVQYAYEAGETTPPKEALEALSNLQPYRSARRSMVTGALPSLESITSPDSASAPPLPVPVRQAGITRSLEGRLPTQPSPDELAAMKAAGRPADAEPVFAQPDTSKAPLDQPPASQPPVSQPPVSQPPVVEPPSEPEEKSLPVAPWVPPVFIQPGMVQPEPLHPSEMKDAARVVTPPGPATLPADVGPAGVGPSDPNPSKPAQVGTRPLSGLLSNSFVESPEPPSGTGGAQEPGHSDGSSAEASRQAPAGNPAGNEETIRVNVTKLDHLVAILSELLVARIRLDQRQGQLHDLQGLLAQGQKDWASIRRVYNRVLREEQQGVLNWRAEPVERAPLSNAAARPAYRPAFPPEIQPDAVPPAWDESDGNPASLPAENVPLRYLEAWEKGQLDAFGVEQVELGKDISQLLNHISTGQNRQAEMAAQVNELTRLLAGDETHLALVLEELEQEIKSLRLLPLRTITVPFARMVRDLAHSAGKDVSFRIVGEMTELDKHVLEQIKDPLIHLLRNAVDHGIETTEERIANGKPARGQIILSAETTGKEVFLRVADDGAGLDLDAIRRAVARRSKLDPSNLAEPDLIDALFTMGMSTSPMLTDISGRGVGLSVVRQNVEAVRGRILVDSSPGHGTSFTLILPMALTGSHTLLVRSSGQVLAIPFTSVDRIVELEPEMLTTLEGRPALIYQDRVISLARLDDVLELPHAPTPQAIDLQPVVIIRVAERSLALLIDGLVGEQELVIKDMGSQVRRVAGVAGASVLGNGEVILVLSAADLIKLALRQQRGHTQVLLEEEPAPDEHQLKHILVVDDSITTRTLEKNILEAAGYVVHLAIDGQNALSVLAGDEHVDLVVSDIVMPRMDGFELTRQIKAMPSTAHLPVILVTSLDSAQDKKRGIEAGADAYIVKSSFDQDNLLVTIEQLI